MPNINLHAHSVQVRQHLVSPDWWFTDQDGDALMTGVCMCDQTCVCHQTCAGVVIRLGSAQSSKCEREVTRYLAGALKDIDLG